MGSATDMNAGGSLKFIHPLYTLSEIRDKKLQELPLAQQIFRNHGLGKGKFDPQLPVEIPGALHHTIRAVLQKPVHSFFILYRCF